MGDVAVHAEFGLNFDGLGDWAEVTAPVGYTDDKSFTINFWASQTLCTIPGIAETLLYHGKPITNSSEYSDNDAMIGLFVICYRDQPQIMTQVKTQSADGEPGPRASLQVTGDENVIQDGSYETANWIQFGVSLSETSLMLYVDGMPVSRTTNDWYGGWGWSNEDGSDNFEGSNQAKPDPMNFGASLGSFEGLANVIHLGGMPTGENFFLGNLQALTIFTGALNMHAHDCLYQELEKSVATCSEPGQPSRGRGGRVNNYFASFLDGEVPDGTYLMGDVFQNGAFGLQFDGDEDYLLIKENTRDFANDGSFAVAFWFTKPVCNIPGRWEFVFSQLENENMPVTFLRNSGVDMFIGCGQRFEVSSIGGDILRTVLVDQARHRAMFDVQIDYFGGGIMTNTWVHVVMNVHKSNAPAPGGRGAAGGRGGATAGRRRAQGGAGDSCTGATPDPRDSMSAEERAAMRNRFEGQGQVTDNGGAEVYINGMKLPMDAMGYPCDSQNPCDGRAAGVIRPTGQNALSERMQAASQVISAGGDDPAAVMAMIFARGDQRPPQGNQPTQQDSNRGNRGSGGGGTGGQSGDSGNSPRGAGGTNRTQGGRDPVINVAVPDPTNFSRPLRGFDSSDVYRDNRAYEIELAKGSPRPGTGPGDGPTGGGLAPGAHVFHAMFTGGFQAGWSGGYWEIVDSNDDIVAGGPVAGRCDGQRQCDMDFTLEDPVDYDEDGMGGCQCQEPCSNTYQSRGRTRTSESWFCRVNDRDNCAMDTFWGGNFRSCLVEDLRVRIVTRTNAAGISWSIDDGAMYDGPTKASIYIGGRAGLLDDHYFVGSIAGLTINSRPLEQHEVECMYLAGEENIGKCGPAESVAFQASMFGNPRDSTPPLTPDAVGAEGDNPVTLHGHTYMDPSFGAVLDGQRDWITFLDRGYTSNDFTISFWFAKKTSCENPGRWEFLYSESADDDGAFFRTNGAALEVYLSCQRDGDRQDRRGQDGDILRTYIRDTREQRAAFDINLDEFRSGGPITSEWVHYVLAVDDRAIRMYIDGTPTGPSTSPVEDDGGDGNRWGDRGRRLQYGGGDSGRDDGQTDLPGGQTLTFADSGFWRWMSDPEQNLAYPNPERLNARLRFEMAEVYNTRRDSAIMLDGLAPDTTYTINFQNGVDAGGWFMINSTVVAEVPGVEAADEVLEACVPFCENVDLTSRWVTTVCGLDPIPAYNIPGWCSYTPANATAGIAAFCVSINDTSACGSTTPLADEPRCPLGCSYQAPAEAVEFVQGVTGEYINLVTQHLTGFAGSTIFTTPPATQTAAWEAGGIFLTMHTPATNNWDTTARLAAELKWDIEGTDLMGPATNEIYLGSRSDVADEHFYMGSMAGVMIQTNDIDDTGAFCAYQSGEKQLGVCDWDSDAVKVNVLGGRNMDGGTRGWGFDLGGEAHLENDYGATLDGMGDYIKIQGDELDYAQSGSFALAFWFTKATCRVLGDYEILYSHHADPEGSAGCRHNPDSGRCSSCNPGIQVMLGCFSDGTDGWTASSTIGGDVIRISLTDDNCNTATWDTPLDVAGGGYVTDAWVHFAMSTWSRGAAVYVDGERIGSDACFPKQDSPSRATRRQCADALYAEDAVAACAAVLDNAGQPMCDYREGIDGHPVAEGRRAARWWGWATTSANMAFPSPWHFQSEMGPYTLWQEPRPGRDMSMNSTLSAGQHSFTPMCRGCTYARTGWGDAYWSIIGPDGTLLAGGEDDGQVVTLDGEDVCESGEVFSRFDQAACQANRCCEWGNIINTDAGIAGADTDENGVEDAVEGGGGMCFSAVGGESCMADDATNVKTFTLEADTEVTVVITVPRNMQNSFVIQWQLDDGGLGKEGPVRAPLYMGQQNEGDDSKWNANSGYSGSIAGIKTFDRALGPTAAKCIFQEAETEVGVCGEVNGVIYEAEFVAGGQAGNDPERDLNGPVQSGVQSIQECLEICQEGYRFFGMQWSSSCQCGNSFGQHGHAPSTDEDVTRDFRGNTVSIPAMDGECNWPCGANHDDSCTALHGPACDNIDIGAVNDDGTEDVDADRAACTDDPVAECSYTPKDDSIILANASCLSSAAEYCSDVDVENEYISFICTADGNSRYDIPGGCVLTTVNGTMSCDAIISDANCTAGWENNATCGEGCTFTEAVTQTESCVATATEACEAVNLDSSLTDESEACEAAALLSGGSTACLYDPEVREMCGAADRNSIYEVNIAATGTDAGSTGAVTADYIGCFLDATSDDAGSLEMVGDTYMDQGESFTGGLEAGFGLTFDGEGDYAVLKRTEGYTSDGTFSVVFWFTKTPCNDPEQPYEMLYSHMNAEGDFRSPHLFIQLGCAHSDVHSTAGNGDIIRIAMQDDDGGRYLFDAPLIDAAGGGYVTSMWIHLALTVSRTGARLFLDGVDVSDHFGHPEPTNRWVRFAQTHENMAYPDPTSFHPGTAPGPLGYRAMAGARMDIDSGMNITWAVATCASFCETEGFDYMGLQWRDECYCDNQYDRRGEGRAVNDGGQNAGTSMCGDTEEHPLPTCTTDEWEDGQCGWANAVFEVQNKSNYLGCWQDGPSDEYTTTQWGGMTMTMDDGYGNGGNDAGEFMINVTLHAGSGTGEDGRQYALEKMGNTGGWSEGTYIEVWQRIVATDGGPGSCVPRAEVSMWGGTIVSPGFEGECSPPVDDACSPNSTYPGIADAEPRIAMTFAPGSRPDCEFVAGTDPVVVPEGGLTRLTTGGYVAAICTNSSGACDVQLRGRGDEARCTAVEGCTYTPASCGDGCLPAPGVADEEDEWIRFSTIADGTPGGNAEIVVKVVVTRWGNGVSWKLANMDLPWVSSPRGPPERRTILAEGPIIGHPTLGSTGGSGWYSHQEYTGSIASVGIYWRPLDAEDVNCLYQRTQNILTVCVPPEDMSGAPFYTNMNPHDLDGDKVDLDSRATVERCAEYCSDYQYFGLEWGHVCSCGNSYGSYGELDASECDRDCSGYDDDEQHANKCGGSFKNSVYEEMRDGRGWSDWAVPTPAAECEGEMQLDDGSCVVGYVNCRDETFDVDSSGVRSQCQCQGQGGIVSSTANEREEFICLSPTGEPGMVRYGSPTFEYKGCFQDRFRTQDGITMFDNTYVDDDYGMTFDGEGDYAEVDAEENLRWMTNDGTFTIAFWVTKTACTVPSWWESVVSWYKYPEMSLNDPRNTHIRIQMGCDSYSGSTLEGDMMRVDTLDDDGNRAIWDFSMDSSKLDGPDTRATDTWVHVVIAFGNRETKMYVDGKDVCTQRRGGGPGQRQRCDGIGFPLPRRYGGRAPDWVMTPCSGDNAAEPGEPCNKAFEGAPVSGFDLTYADCATCIDSPLGDDAQYDCASVIAWMTGPNSNPAIFNASAYEDPVQGFCTSSLAAVSAAAGQPADVNSSITFADVCMVSCGTCEDGELLVPGCDMTNRSSPGANQNNPRGRNSYANLYLGGAPKGAGRFFTGSLNGFGMFRHPLTQQEASCLFRFGEFDIHVCPKVENMNGLLHAMTFLPAEPAMPRSLPHGGGRCRGAVNDCVVQEVEEACTPMGHEKSACWESASRTVCADTTTGECNDMEVDNDCCAPIGTAACAPGYTMMNQTTAGVCWFRGDVPAAYNTFCIPNGDLTDPDNDTSATIPQIPMPTDCTFTAGDATTCSAAVGCTYTAPVAAQVALTEEVIETCEPAASNAHCAWASADCSAPWINTDNQAAACHDNEADCTGRCLGTSWCPHVQEIDCMTGFTPGDESTCIDGCTYTAPVAAGDPVCAEEDMPAMCEDVYDDTPGRCVYAADDNTTDAYDPSCSDPMGTPDAAAFCQQYCARTDGWGDGNGPGRGNGRGPGDGDGNGDGRGSFAAGPFSFFGLSGANDCFCGNEYDSGGIASPTECDAAHSGTMDCGTFDADRAWWRATTTGACRARIAVYSVVDGSEIGCYRNPTSAPQGLSLGGNAYLDDSGRHSGGSWRSGVGEVDDTSFDDFGIHFDGDGDYAQINGVDNGYAADGTFAISLWATKPNCMTSGKEEIIYKHGNRRGATIMILYVCSNDPNHQHSTVQQVRGDGREFADANFARIYLQDDDGKRALFDVSIDKDGGFVTDTWVHLLVAVHHDHIRAYVDGQRQWRVGYPIPVPHIMNDQQNQRLQVAYGQDPHEQCAKFCAGYAYSGVQNTDNGQQCLCDDELPSTSIAQHCKWPGADGTVDCSAPIDHGAADYCHASQNVCEGVCSEGGTNGATWCPAANADLPDDALCAGCGFQACEDNQWLCTAERLTGGADLPVEAAELQALCNTDMHTMAGMGAWISPGTFVSSMCPMMCNACTGELDAEAEAALRAGCRDTVAVTELATRANGDVVVLGPVGCYADTPDAGGDNWQDPETNAAFPSINDIDIGTFNIDRGYGDGGRDRADYYIPVTLATTVSEAGSMHEFHAHGRWGDDDGWNGGSWRVLSADGDLCANITDVSDGGDLCAAAGVCTVQPDVEESCETAYADHTPSACLEIQADGSWGTDDNCCAIPGNGDCAPGFSYTQGGPCSRNGQSFRSYCADDTLASEGHGVYDDCSGFVAGNASSCALGCAYTASTQKCAAAVFASGRPSEQEEFTSFNITNTGGMACTATDGVARGCMIAMDTDDNMAACQNAVGATCTFTAGDGDVPDSCTATAITACAAATDEHSCNTVGNATQFGNGNSGCTYTAPDTTVVVHINTVRWGNYISWELRDQATGSVEGSGPDTSPIELGGTEALDRWGDRAPFESFIGNIADLLIFYREPSDDDVDCLYREQQASLGKCRAPDGMWGTAFWDTLTSAEAMSPSLRLWGNARIEDGMGIDLTANNQPMAMSGSWALMDGLANDFEAYPNITVLPELTVAGCVARCTALEYRYAGLMAGRNCVCDNSYNMYGEHQPTAEEIAANSDGCDAACVATPATPESCTAIDPSDAALCADASPAACNATASCNYTAAVEAYRPTWGCGARACAGDDTGACGGAFKLAVYDTSDDSYLGCYDDHDVNSVGAIRMRDGNENFAKDGSFSISLWFTHNHCDNVNATGMYEPLYHQSGEYCEGCPPQGIDVFLTCGVTRSIGGDMVTGNWLSVWAVDDDGKMASLSVPIGQEGSRDETGGRITAAWVHFALTVDEDAMAIYIDGVAVTRYADPSTDWGENLAAGHIGRRELWRNDGVVQLGEKLSGMTFGADSTVCIPHASTPADTNCTLDGMDGDNAPTESSRDDCPSECSTKYVGGPMLGAYFGEWQPSFFNGYIANLGIFRRSIDKSEVSCLYKYGETHLGLPTLGSGR